MNNITFTSIFLLFCLRGGGGLEKPKNLFSEIKRRGQNKRKIKPIFIYFNEKGKTNKSYLKCHLDRSMLSWYLIPGINRFCVNAAKFISCVFVLLWHPAAILKRPDRRLSAVSATQKSTDMYAFDVVTHV